MARSKNDVYPKGMDGQIGKKYKDLPIFYEDEQSPETHDDKISKCDINYNKKSKEIREAIENGFCVEGENREDALEKAKYLKELNKEDKIEELPGEKNYFIDFKNIFKRIEYKVTHLIYPGENNIKILEDLNSGTTEEINNL